MINRLTNLFLKKYDEADFVLQQKAKVLFYIFILILFFIVPAYIITYYIIDMSPAVRTVLFCVVLFTLIMLFLLRAGYFSIAGHTFLIISFLAMWTVMFLYKYARNIIEVLDTTASIIALLSLTPLIFIRKKIGILFYFSINSIILIVFMIVIHSKYGIDNYTFIEYLMENIVAMVFVGAISYQIFAINDRSLKHAREAEETIRKREELFRGIIDESPLVMIILDEDGNFQFVSDENSQVFGYTLKDIPTLSKWWEMAYPLKSYRKEIQEMWQKAIDETSSTGNLIQLPDTRVTCKDKSIRDMHIRYTSIGSSGKYLILLDDITDRKETERALISSENKYRKLYDSMLDGFVSMDMDGKIIEFNEAYQRMTGYSAHELLQMTNMDLTPLKWHNYQEKILQNQVMVRGHSDIYEKEYIKKDGKIFPVELRTYLIQDDNGDNRGMWAIVHDITNRKDAERELLKASKIESLGILAGGIAHDFNNLLTAIVGNISVAKLNLDEKDENFELLSEVEKASLRAKDLTQQLLTFSKGGAPIKIITSIQDLLKDTVDFVLRGSHIKGEFFISDRLWNAEVDEGQISQVIHNLVLNSREAMHDGGTLTVKAENVILGDKNKLPLPEGKYIKIQIIDTGQGIPEINQNMIFDPFYTTKEKGNGLGLSVTYSIIKKHEGHIELTSAVNKGTTFTIYIPATEMEINEENEPELINNKLSGRILLMDDEEMIRNVGKNILSHMGYKTKCAENGEVAIQMYKEALKKGRPFDAVIMDLTVPGSMGGKETIKVLKDFDPDIKAIVSSGYSNDPVMAKYEEFGFSGVVAKPYRFEDLRNLLSKILSMEEKEKSDDPSIG